MDDSTILRLLVERSEDAAVELERKYGAACRKLASGILPDPRDAEECVNDALLRVWNSVPPEVPSMLGAYLLRVTRNLAIDRRRKSSAQMRSAITVCIDELAECLPSDSDVEHEVQNAELAKVLSGFLDGLKRMDRLVFVRRYWYFDTAPEIASATGLSHQAVRTKLSRTRKKLRIYLEKLNERNNCDEYKGS